MLFYQKKLLSIGGATFQNDSSITSIDVPNSVTTIGNAAFSGCSKITSVVIGTGVTSIGRSCFERCTLLSSVTVKAVIPPTLGDNVFLYNASGRKIYVPIESLEQYKVAEGWSVYASDIEGISI